MQYLQFKIFEPYKNLIKHGLTTRDGGVSTGYLASLNLSLLNDENEKSENVRENYRRFCETIGVDLQKLVMAYQQHTDQVKVLKKGELSNFDFGLGNEIEGVDGFITDIVGLPLMVRFADCQGVLMLDPVKKVVSAVHCGWRGNAKNIIGKTLEAMKKEFYCDPRNILVGISASLGPCCAEFSDPEKELPVELHKFVNENRKADLWKCSLEQITTTGVLPQHVEITSRCTICENDRFFSYRAGKKKTGHMGAVIQLL